MGGSNRHEASEVEVELAGMPVSVGQVTGTARVVKHLSDAHLIQVKIIYDLLYHSLMMP